MGAIRRRWHGDPREQRQPDAGDVVTHVDPESGVWAGGPIFRVHHARMLSRGPHAGLPHELELVGENVDVSAWSDQSATQFIAVRRGRR